MKLSVGETIRALRRRDGRTQEALAEALGVTGQAVSRWEAGGSYPDLELIPAIAHFFGVSIDELFGYTSERDKKIDAVIARIDAFGIRARGDDGWVDECLSLLREALAEFPQNERLLITLADTLSEAGWRRHHEWVYYDEEGYMQHGYDKHKSNAYWTESVKICERLLETTHDNAIYTRAVHILVLLYRNFGETEKALACAARMPALRDCRELLRASGISPISKATSENVETLLALCVQGVGACFCPENLLQTALSPEQLAQLHILPLCPSASYPICFGYLRRSYPWSVLSEFILIAREQTA